MRGRAKLIARSPMLAGEVVNQFQGNPNSGVARRTAEKPKKTLKPYECPVCHRRFATEPSCRNHLSKKHSVSVKVSIRPVIRPPKPPRPVVKRL
jgi:hypothetical protein